MDLVGTNTDDTDMKSREPSSGLPYFPYSSTYPPAYLQARLLPYLQQLYWDVANQVHSFDFIYLFFFTLKKSVFLGQCSLSLIVCVNGNPAAQKQLRKLNSFLSNLRRRIRQPVLKSERSIFFMMESHISVEI